MSTQPDYALITEWQTTAIWRWAVVPVSNPFIFIPAPTWAQAHAIAKDVDRGGRPEMYCYREVPADLRDRLSLPHLPELPELPGRAYSAWTPVSGPAAKFLERTPAIVESVMVGERAQFIATSNRYDAPPVARMVCRERPNPEWLRRSRIAA
ncbi:hypothetical protein [Nocardia africana]